MYVNTPRRQLHCPIHEFHIALHSVTSHTLNRLEYTMCRIVESMSKGYSEKIQISYNKSNDTFIGVVRNPICMFFLI